MDDDNGYEWEVALTMIWHELPWIAFLGPLSFLWSFISIVGVFISKPDISTKWESVSLLELYFMETTLYVGAIGEPYLFILTQIFTLGKSNFSDISLLYMSNVWASLFFVFNTVLILFLYPYSILHFCLFWWIYAIQLVLWLIRDLFEDEHDDDE